MQRVVYGITALAFVATNAQAQPGPPIRVLDSATASTTEKIASAAQVRALSGGRVLVNDATARRLLLFDSTMQLIRVVADSQGTGDNTYGRAGKLLPYRGDSSLLIDGQTLSMLVLDGDANIARITATPRAAYATFLAGTTYGNPGIDPLGRLVFRISDPSAAAMVAIGGGIVVPEQPDSAPLLRLDFDSRRIDTLGNVKIQKRITEAYRTPSGSISTRTLTTPMPMSDDWAVLSDGSVAFVRHRDYHIDWITPQGVRHSTPAMPFEWQRMTDDHKAAFVDSVRKSLEDQRWKDIARYDSLNYHCFNLVPPERLGATARYVPPPAAPVVDPGAAAQPPSSGRAAAAAAGAGAVAGAGAAAAAGSGRGNAAGGAAGATPSPLARPANCPAGAYIVDQMFGELNVVKPTALPDYKPPFSLNATRPDADGNLWIRMNQMRPVANTFLYDVINRRGELFDRIQMPTDRTLVGFAPGNIAYVLAKVGAAVKLERVRWRQ